MKNDMEKMSMYTEVTFSNKGPAPGDGYVGGGVKLPSGIQWPAGAAGEPLVHLFSVPATWFSDQVSGARRISVFIPYEPRTVTHYRKLRARDGRSDAVVIAYDEGDSERSESQGVVLERGRMERVLSKEIDDDENLASKVDGVDAWLQSPINIEGFQRRLSIYGGDLDLVLLSTTGILSDGMGYLFLSGGGDHDDGGDFGRFFLQLG
jgi:hypothetical protein